MLVILYEYLILLIRTPKLKSVFYVLIKKLCVYKNDIKVNNIYLKKYYLSPIIISCTKLLHIPFVFVL